MRPFLFTGISLVLAASAASSEAQGLAQPLRSSPSPADPSRTTQQLTVGASALGGYDDNPMAEGGPIQSPDGVKGTFTGFADLSVRYWRGRPLRSFSLEGSGYMLSYSSLSIDSPIGGQVRFGAGTAFGRSHRLEVVQQVRTDPYVAFGAFGPLLPDLGPGVGPDANPANGLNPERSWGSFTSASVDWRWTQRTTLTTAYDYVRNEYIGNTGFDNRAHTARLALDRSLTRTVALAASYRYADTVVVERPRDATLPVVEHTGEIGFDWAKALSRTRHVEFSAGGGAAHIETVSRVGNRGIEYWTPSGHASVRADIGRTWAVSATYRRGLAFLDGITPEFFLADVVLLRTEGLAGRRLELMFSSGYSNGKQQAQLLLGRYETFTVNAQARVAIARPWSVVVDYSGNDYRLFGFPAPPEGPLSRYQRNAIRIGMTYSFTRSPTRSERPGRPGRRES